MNTPDVVQSTPPQTSYDHPTEADKWLYLLKASRTYAKMLIGSVTSIRAFYGGNPQGKKLIDNMARTNQAALAAQNEFEQYLHQKVRLTPEQKETARRIEALYQECAFLAYRTPLHMIDDLGAYVENFRQGRYASVDPQIIESLQKAPEDFSAGLYEALHRYFPDAEPLKKKGAAMAIEQLFQVRQDLNVRV